MHYLPVLQVLMLITVANGSPVLAKRIFGGACAQPLDGNIAFFDGRPLLGTSKTIRGIIVSLLATTVCAPLFGLDMALGMLVAATAMAGDLLSSFVKRRLAFAPSSRAAGLDQIPESLFPLLACREALALTAPDIIAGTVLFFIGEILLSRLLFRLRVRDRPY